VVGAIGTNLAHTISQLNAHMVIILDDMSAAYEWNIPSLPNVLLVKSSVTDEIALKRVFASGAETNILQMAERINELTGNKAGILRAEPRKWDTKKRLLAKV